MLPNIIYYIIYYIKPRGVLQHGVSAQLAGVNVSACRPDVSGLTEIGTISSPAIPAIPHRTCFELFFPSTHSLRANNNVNVAWGFHNPHHRSRENNTYARNDYQLHCQLRREQSPLTGTRCLINTMRVIGNEVCVCALTTCQSYVLRR